MGENEDKSRYLTVEEFMRGAVDCPLLRELYNEPDKEKDLDERIRGGQERARHQSGWHDFV